MKFSKFLFLVVLAAFAIFGAQSVFAAGNINASSKYSQFLNTDLDNNATNDRINWSPTNGGATVGDATITGNIWGETVGWINLNPTNGGVTNTCDGDVGGYAWGQNTGWVNFNPTQGGVTIDPGTGEFDGHAWSQNYGWIKFDCGSVNSCVITDWAGCTTDPDDPDDDDDPSSPNSICHDGLDNDSDGLTDYPNDPGCTSFLDNTEENPFVQNTYICSDGLDNDSDGYTDYPSDPGCQSTTDSSEYNAPTDPIDPTDDPDDSTDPGTDPPPGSGPGGDPTSDGPGTIPSYGGNSITKLLLDGWSAFLKPVGIAFSLIGLASTIPGFALRAANVIFSIPFFRRRRPWGIVYDAETKQPLDPATVVVYNTDTNQPIDNKITDINGRYGFLLPLGNYRIIANKTHYQFPSTKLPHTTSDGVYDNLYFGESFSITDAKRDSVVTLNIPMDRLEVDWNQEEKKRMGIFDFITRNSKVWEWVSLTLFGIGFAFSIYVMIVSPNTWNTIVFMVYIIGTIMQLVGYGPITVGSVHNASDQPVPNAVVRVWNAHLGVQIGQRITNDIGQYYLLVPKGDYYVTVDVKNNTGGYDRVLTSGTIRAHQGIINKSFTLQ